MMGLEDIRRLNRQSTRAAARSGNLPRKWEGEREGFRVPFIGERTPRGFRRTKREPQIARRGTSGAVPLRAIGET